MSAIPTATPEEIKAAFNTLEKCLSTILLPTFHGGGICLTASDFMFMGKDPNNGSISFKSRETRNYVYLIHDRLFMPRFDKPFHKGVF